MAEKDNQELNNLNIEDEFIQEKIKNKRRQNLRNKLITVAFVLLCGLVFGFAARMSMIFTDGKLKELIGGLEKTPTPSGIMTPSPIDNTTTPNPSSPVISSVPVTLTPVPTDLAEISPLPTLTPIEGEITVNIAGGEVPGPFNQISSLYTVLAAISEAVRPQVAEITAVKTYIDWFGDVSRVSSMTSGLIIANNGTSLLMLADYNMLAGSVSISVKVYGKELEGQIYSYDSDYGLAIVAIDFSAFTEEEREAIKYAKLSPDNEIKLGNPIVAVGSPNGYSGSVSYGIVTGTGYKNVVTDGEVKTFTADWTDYKNGSAFVYGCNGSVYGMITHIFKQNADDGVVTCVSLESLKEVINALLNGRSPLYMGVKCSNLTADVTESSGLNFGLLVEEVIGLSPAAAAEIKAGDIIFAINEQRIQSVSELSMLLAGIQTGEAFTIDYRRVDENGIKDERVIVTPVSKAARVEQKGK